MAFPTSPSDGDTYENLMWNNTLGAWDKIPEVIMSGQMGTVGDLGAGLVLFNEFWVDEGGITYSSSTKRFTVPLDGQYRITMNPFFKNTVIGGRIFIGINTDTPGASTHYGHAYRETSSYDTTSLNSIVSLSANDYIVFRLYAGVLHNNSGDKFNQFTIERLA